MGVGGAVRGEGVRRGGRRKEESEGESEGGGKREGGARREGEGEGGIGEGCGGLVTRRNQTKQSVSEITATRQYISETIQQ